MKRNFDLIRQILLEVESKDSPMGWEKIEFDEFESLEVAYHIDLLMQAGLVTGTNLTTSSGYDFVVKNLTWQGHEFLDSIRQDTRWNRIKQKLGNRLSSLSFSVLSKVAQSEAISELSDIL